MKKHFMMVAILAIMVLAMAAVQQPETMKRLDDGTYVVNTTDICKAVGYKGRTPVEVHFKRDRIQKLVALKNQETPKYFAMAMKFLKPKYENMNASVAAKVKIDGVTGATYSSDAIKENVRAAVEYYKKHKKEFPLKATSR